MRWALGGSAVLFAAMMLVIVAAVAMFGSQNCGTGSPGSPTAPLEGTQSEAQVVRYLESQGFSPFGAAGIVGNLEQESTLNPADSGGGLAQWNPSWYGEMSAWATGHGLSPISLAGQLEYLVYDLHSSYPKLISELNSATSPSKPPRSLRRRTSCVRATSPTWSWHRGRCAWTAIAAGTRSRR